MSSISNVENVSNTGHTEPMTKRQFRTESDYLSARDIALALKSMGLLTGEEFGQIDTILRQKFPTVLGCLFADFPCYVDGHAA